MAREKAKVYAAVNSPVGPIICAYSGKSAKDVLVALSTMVPKEASLVSANVRFLDTEFLGELFYTED